MLHAVLCLPPELWLDTELDKMQRYARYLEASRRIEDCEREISRLRNLLKSIMAYAGEREGLITYARRK
jgi:hypothetical protein